MRESLALIRANWLTQTSYRVRTIFGMVSILISIVPLYFVSDALQPVMAESISDEGGQYFGFLVVGTMTMLLINAAVQSLPGSVSAGIARGTIEALLSTPASLTSLLVGMIGAGILWMLVRVLVLIIGSWALGAPIHFTHLFPGIVILILTMLAYLPFGILAAAMVLVFRTAGPIPQGITYLSILLGGVYYPTKVIPSWIQNLSDFVPLTYSLRALRRVLLDGAAIETVAPDLLILLGFVVGLLAFACATFLFAYRYARKAGTLAQY